jgi:hypothetical protein
MPRDGARRTACRAAPSRAARGPSSSSSRSDRCGCVRSRAPWTSWCRAAASTATPRSRDGTRRPVQPGAHSCATV